MRTAPTRTRRATLRTERVQALGPATMGVPLLGRFADLHAVWWALFWHPTRGLLLQQDSVVGWREVTPERAFPPATRTMRHIGLAFDQSAHHAATWEDLEQITVRQWDPAIQTYIYRGPFQGVDPLLFTDTTASFYSPDSDIVLLYLNPARDTLYARYQRDAYGIEEQVVTGLTAAVLDQVVVLPYAAQVRGENAGADWTVDLGLYPYRASDAAYISAALAQGELRQLLFPFDSVNTANVAATFTGGHLDDTLYARSGVNTASVAAALIGGQLDTVSLSRTTVNTANVAAALVGGASTIVQFGVTSANTTSVSAALTGGSYGP